MARIHRRTVQKDLHDPDNHDGVITDLEPDILECEVKWVLGSITMNKASGGDGIPVSISNPGRWCCESVALNISACFENSAVATALEKVSFNSNPKERQWQRMFKLLSDTKNKLLMYKTTSMTLKVIMCENKNLSEEKKEIS